MHITISASKGVSILISRTVDFELCYVSLSLTTMKNLQMPTSRSVADGPRSTDFLRWLLCRTCHHFWTCPLLPKLQTSNMRVSRLWSIRTHTREPRSDKPSHKAKDLMFYCKYYESPSYGCQSSTFRNHLLKKHDIGFEHEPRRVDAASRISCQGNRSHS